MEEGSRSGSALRALVLSRHEAVRQQLAAYLARSPEIAVAEDDYALERLEANRPDVLVLDLSRVNDTLRREVLALAVKLGAGVVALASIPSPDEEDEVRAAGGTYRLKEVGATGLAEAVLAAYASRMEPRRHQDTQVLA